MIPQLTQNPVLHTLTQLAFILHVGGGTIALLFGIVAIVVRKGSRIHRLAGTVFFVSMLVMATFAAYLSVAMPGQIVNLVIATMTLYLVATAWLTVHRKEGAIGRPEKIAFAVILLVLVPFALLSFQLATGMKPFLNSAVPLEGPVLIAIYLFTLVVAIAAVSDAKVLLAGGIAGAPRVARHLWRMCVGLALATGSAFTNGLPRLLPGPMHVPAFFSFPSSFRSRFWSSGSSAYALPAGAHVTEPPGRRKTNALNWEARMRLRQIALVAKDLEPHVAMLDKVLGLKVAYRDPGVGVFGLVNAVFAIGAEFLEIVQPVKDDASAARYLKRRGGDAGYMVILQADDAVAHRARVLGMGVRKIWEHDTDAYKFTHFHPGDFSGVLTSIDSVGSSSWREQDGLWPPAGKDWRTHRSDPDVVGLSSVTIQAPNPKAVAKRWGELLEAAVADGATDVKLGRGTIRFCEPVDQDGTGVVAIDVEHRHPDDVLARAKANGLATDDNAFRICGIAINLVGA